MKNTVATAMTFQMVLPSDISLCYKKYDSSKLITWLIFSTGGGGGAVINFMQRRVADFSSENYLFKTMGIITRIFKL